MKITETRLKEIIKEEMELHDPFMEYQDEEGGMAKRQLENLAAYASELALGMSSGGCGGSVEPLDIHPTDGFEIEDEHLNSLFEE